MPADTFVPCAVNAGFRFNQMLVFHGRLFPNAIKTYKLRNVPNLNSPVKIFTEIKDCLFYLQIFH